METPGRHNGSMSRQSLPEELRADLRARIGPDLHILALAQVDEGCWLIAGVDELGLFRDGTWEIWPWEKVLGGGWRKEPPALHWFTIDDTRECRLEVPGELPVVFRERVQAATVMSASFDVTGGTVTLTARRAPRSLGDVEWLASASGGASLDDPDTAALVLTETDRLREEYGL